MTGPYFQNFETEGFPIYEDYPEANWMISGNVTDSGNVLLTHQVLI